MDQSPMVLVLVDLSHEYASPGENFLGTSFVTEFIV